MPHLPPTIAHTHTVAHTRLCAVVDVYVLIASITYTILSIRQLVSCYVCIALRCHMLLQHMLTLVYNIHASAQIRAMLWQSFGESNADTLNHKLTVLHAACVGVVNCVL